jgi:DMSO/TMAO reductase YedYZ molybdopterin-dependent catalytic subunit
VSVTKSPHHLSAAPEGSGLRPSGTSRHRPTRSLPGPFPPEFWQSPLRGPWLTSLLGTLLVPAVTLIALTGMISHWAYYPELSGNATVNPGDIPVLFHFPGSWPSWSYALNQGTHVTLGLMTLPFILAKLWSVMPKLFLRPVVRNFAGALERISLLLLVGSVLLEFATGILDIDSYYRLPVDFRTIHYYGAWVFVTMAMLHACIKLPTVRRAYRERGVLKPLRQGLSQTVPEPPTAGGLAPVNPAAPTISRRGLFAMLGGASLAIFAVQSGSSIGGPIRRLALLAPRGRVFGTGPNDFQVNHTAASARITAAMTGANWRLTLVGRRTMSLTREQLLSMAQTTHTLTIACTEGWSTTQQWRGVRLADLAKAVDAPQDAILGTVSIEGWPSVWSSFSQSQWSSERALLALRVNDADLSLDHGYPARVIVPNVPGTHNTKWISELRFEAV